VTSDTPPLIFNKATIASTAVSFAVPLFAALLLGWYGASLPLVGIGSSTAIAYWLAILMTTWLAFETGGWAPPPIFYGRSNHAL
jgi:hypothetical protein